MQRTMAILGTMALVGCSDGSFESLLGLDMYFVKLDEDPAQVAATAQSIATLFGLEVVHTYDSATEGFSVKLPDLVVSRVEGLAQVEYIVLDEQAHQIPPEEELEAPPVDDPAELLIGDDEIPESLLRIGAPYAGDGLDPIHVAVVDSGVDGSHPDLNVVGEIDIVAQSGGTPAPGADPNGHGTHCAGTIGARADGEGVVGVAPGVALHAVRVLDASGSGYWTDIVAGLEYVLDHPEIRVVNLSLGGPAFPDGTPDPLADAIVRLEDAGVVVVIAAGNEAGDVRDFSPANYDLGIVVSAYDAAGGDQGFAWFSNYGQAVDLAAPGVDIASTYPGGQYAELSGTSMATPAVAGAAAAYLAQHPNAGPAEVRAQLVDSAEGGLFGGGGDHPEPLLDVAALLP